MRDFLFQYHSVAPTTWVYLSSLLMIGLFFKFSRFWSLRNLDLIMLIGLAPGLLLIYNGNFMQVAAQAESESQLAAGDTSEASTSTGSDDLTLSSTAPSDAAPSDAAPLGLAPLEIAAGDSTQEVSGEQDATTENTAAEASIAATLKRGQNLERWGYYTLFAVGLAWLVRLLLDSTMTRRPLIAPNLSVGGLTFIGVALFVFLMANVVAREPMNQYGIASDTIYDVRMDALLAYQQHQGPGYTLLGAVPEVSKRILIVLSHLGIVIGVALIGYRHFANATNGIGAATLYLMLPYTSQMTGRLDHSLPAALIVFAVLFYRRPVAAGILLGAAAGCIYYPFFLLPLWASFYWKRGLLRFIGGAVVAVTVMAIGLISLPDSQGFLTDVQRMLGAFLPAMTGLLGVWDAGIGGWDSSFRIPVLAAFVVLAVSLVFWPSPKNLGSLLSCTAAVMVACQFWHGYGGGLYMAWYLPTLLLTMFRPNLEDRGIQLVFQGRWAVKRTTVRASPQAEAAA